MTTREIFDYLKQKFGEAIAEINEEVATPFIRVKPESWMEIAQTLRDDERLAFDFLRSVCGVDYPEQETIASVYHLFSLTHRHDCVIKVFLNRENPKLESVVTLWPAADWHEREAFDLFGIQYEGHPNLRRILLPDDWDGHPLRKDYKYPETYHGINNIG